MGGARVRVGPPEIWRMRDGALHAALSPVGKIKLVSELPRIASGPWPSGRPCSGSTVKRSRTMGSCESARDGDNDARDSTRRHVSPLVSPIGVLSKPGATSPENRAASSATATACMLQNCAFLRLGGTVGTARFYARIDPPEGVAERRASARVRHGLAGHDRSVCRAWETPGIGPRFCRSCSGKASCLKK